MFASFAIAVLLGASSVLGIEIPCNQLQSDIIRHNKYVPGERASVTPINFQNRIHLVHPARRSSKHRFPTIETGEKVPRLNVNGKTYVLHSYAPVPLPIDGTASLLLLFHLQGSQSPDEGVSIIVPMLIFKKWVPNLNEDLDYDLNNLWSFSNFKIKEIDVSIAFIAPLLKNAVSLKMRQSNRKYFMVDCERISADDVMAYFK